MRGRCDRWRRPGALVTPDFGATVPDVDGNDGGNDATRRHATGSALFERSPVAARARSSVRFDGILRCRILCGLVAFQSDRSIGPMDLARLRVVIAADDGRQFDCRRADLLGSRRFPVLAAKESLSRSLPFALELSYDRLARRTSRSFSHGMEAWPVLHGLLLASDATAFRGRRDESALDHGAGGLCFIRADYAKDLASIANIRAGSARVWWVVNFRSEGS